LLWKDDGDGEMGEGGYSDDVGGNVMDEYQQSADDDESDLEQDVVNEDYIVEESDDFDVTVTTITCCFLYIHCWVVRDKCCASSN